MKIKRIVLGTGNPGKFQEWKSFLEGAITVASISEFGKLPEPKESGETFGDNARQKAVHYAKLTGEYVFSDDGGYEVDALGGAPGARSRRILPGGKVGTDQDLINYVLEKLRKVPKHKRSVRLTSAAVLSDPAGNIIFEEKGSLPGIVAYKPGPVLIEGYPFRSIHFIPALGKTYAQLTPEEHDIFNHKKPIAEKLIKFLLEY